LFLFAVGVLAGIMGIFFFAPILAVCGLCKSLSVHRSGIIAHWSVLPSQFSAYGTLVIFIAVGLYFFNTAIQKRIGNAPQFPTANEIAAAVVSKSPQTPTTEQPLRSKSPGTDAKPLSSPNSER
jgi:hypothetical protein